jgi:hypothetical protein
MPESNILENRGNSCQPKKTEVVFSSNSVRLSGYEWIFVGVVALALFCFGPRLWERVEKFKPQANYRLPYELSNDYWLYSRYSRFTCSQYEIVVVGDSVIWGHYVSQYDTLSGCLNKIAGSDRFANLGVDGIHPAALAGLLKYYGRDISNKKVILHFNPLWMSSEKHDLQTEKEFHFNHPKLVSQFVPKIPCYKVPYSKRISAVAERYVPLFGWTSHLKINYFESMDLPSWTLEHPYENPLSAVTLRLPTSANDIRNENISWTKRGVAKTDFQWVEPESSLQWKFFRRSVEVLKEKGNSVFVLVGPFNEHMLKGESIEVYRTMKSKIEDWLQKNNIAYHIPPALPSELYADASHPLSEGYNMLAKQLFESESFKHSIINPGSDLN